MTREQMRETLKHEEKLEPKNFIKLEKTTISNNIVVVQEKGFFQDEIKKHKGHIIEGSITHIGNFAYYTDIRCKVIFYDKRNEVIKTYKNKIKGVIKPFETLAFEMVIDENIEFENFKFEILNAETTN